MGSLGSCDTGLRCHLAHTDHVLPCDAGDGELDSDRQHYRRKLQSFYEVHEEIGRYRPPRCSLRPQGLWDPRCATHTLLPPGVCLAL